MVLESRDSDPASERDSTQGSSRGSGRLGRGGAGPLAQEPRGQAGPEKDRARAGARGDTGERHMGFRAPAAPEPLRLQVPP